MGNLRQIKQKILTHLKKENMSATFIDGVKNELIQQKTCLKIYVTDNNKKNWEYFSRRIGEKGICRADFVGNILEIKFNTFNTKEGRIALKKEMEEVLKALERKYYTVNPEKKIFAILVKPTHRCNLDCKYCYEKPNRDTITTDMEIACFEKLVGLLSNYTEKVQIIWHGGEPTLAGIEWYERAYHVLSKYPMLEIESSMQTNGTNLNCQWVDLFKTYCISPGVSYNAFHQESLRSYHEANERKSNIINNIMLCKEQGISIGVIDVITSVNYKHQIEIYEYYKEKEIGVCMNHIFHTPQTEKYGIEISAEEYSKEFLRYFKHWLYDSSGVNERSAKEALCLVIGDRGLTCKHQDCRYEWLGVNADGFIYPCDRYFPEIYRLGHVSDFNSIQEIFSSNPYRLYVEHTQKRFDTTCQKCGYWEMCRGGCNGSSAESTGSVKGVEKFFCESFRLNFRGVYEIIRELDIVEDEHINPIAKEILITNNFYSVKDIRRHLLEKTKVDLSILEYNPDDLLNCGEYRVFRGINEIQDRRLHSCIDHIDFIGSYDELTKKYNHKLREEKLTLYLRRVAENARRIKHIPNGCNWGNV
jgi:radical SAM protein with 4Fe4S-binding SPASM domain